MDINANRAVTVLILVGFVGIIAAASSTKRAVQNSTNVVVTNSGTQVIPVRDAAHGKDGLTLFRSSTLVSGGLGQSMEVDAIPGERFVVTDISMNSAGSDITKLISGADVVLRSGNSVIDHVQFPLTAFKQTTVPCSAGSLQTKIYLDPGQFLEITANRTSTGTQDTYDFKVSGYRVTYP
jgi:hypothetical protein